jgi:hypothetical protein
MLEDLVIIADRLDKTGLYGEANELDMILATAAMPGGLVFSQLYALMDASGKDTFSKDEINKLIENANDLMSQYSKHIRQVDDDTSIQLALGIKALTDDVIRLRDTIWSGSKDKDVYNAYIKDVMELSNSLTTFNNMLSGNQQDIKEAARVRENAGDSINKANELIKEFFKFKLDNFDWSQRFTGIIENLNKLKTKREEIANLMAEEKTSVESAGKIFDSRDSKHSYKFKDIEIYDNAVRREAKEIMKYYDVMALVNPGRAQNLRNQLGNIFSEVKKMS